MCKNTAYNRFYFLKSDEKGCNIVQSYSQHRAKSTSQNDFQATRTGI
jgi:hypothetical protein